MPTEPSAVAPATLSPGVKKLFTDKNFGHLGTLMKDGSPHVSVVWVDLDGGRILVNSAEGRVKVRNVRYDPRVAISINDPSGYPSATVRGRVVELTHEGADAHIDKLAKKYMGQDTYPFHRADQQRVIIVIEPQQVFGMMTD